MNDEVRAAIERRRSFNASPDCRSPILALNDCQTLADAYLAEHPADDGEPVTVEWLRSIGATEKQGWNGIWIRNVRWMRSDQYEMLTFGDKILIQKFRGDITRGDVRRLLAALKIEVKV